MSSIGFSNLEKKIIDNGITGEILIHADNELLKELDIKSVGVRLKLLNSIYGLKLKYNVPIEDYDYIPKSIKIEMEKDMIFNETKYKIIDNKYKENEQSVNKLVNEVKKINEDMKQFKDEIKVIRTLMSMPKELCKVKSNSNTNLFGLTSEPENTAKTSETIKVYSALEKQECETLYKTFKITVEDTTGVFITEVLKKYQIKDNTALYKLSINSERYLENDEHPLEVLRDFIAKGITANIFLRKINGSKDELKPVPLNTIKSDTDKAYVLLPYKKKKDNEVSVELGEMIEILDKENPDKYRVQKKGGIIGYLPTECFVEINPGDEMQLYDTPLEGEIKKDYKKLNAYEVSLKKGDKVKLYAKFRTWMYVDSNKKQGWMPTNNIDLNSQLTESHSLEEIHNRFEDFAPKLRLHNDFGSTPNLFNGNAKGTPGHFNELNESRNHNLDNDKEMLIRHTMEIKKLTHGPVASSVENIHSPTSPKRIGINGNVIKTSMHTRSSSNDSTLASSNQGLLAKHYINGHSRNNSCDHYYIDKELPPSPHAQNMPPRDNEIDRNNGQVKNNSFTKLNDLLYNFPPPGESKQSPNLNRSNSKLPH